MTVRKIDHVGINVNDLAAAKAFFLDLGFTVQGEAEMEGEWLDRIVGLRDVKTAIVMLQTPDGETGLELVKFYSPPDERGLQQTFPNTLGIRHVTFVVDDIEAVVANLKKKSVELFSEIQRYEDSYKLIYIRGPEGIILELGEELK